jgi:hypothetical protein
VVVKVFVGVAVCPKADLGPIQDEFIEIAAVGTVNEMVMLISGVCALPTGRVMPYHYHSVTVIALCSPIADHCADVLPHAAMIRQCVFGRESPDTAGMAFVSVFDTTIIVHTGSGMLHGQGVGIIEIGPESTANEQIVIDDFGFFFQEIHIVEIMLIQHALDAVTALGEIAVIVFVIAHDHDHMRKPIAGSGKEILDALAASTFKHVVGVGTTNVSGHADVTAEDQDINRVRVLDIKIAKLEMEIAGHI